MYTFSPIPALQNFVIRIWAAKWYDATNPAPIYYARANGAIRLVFGFRETSTGTLELLFSSVHGQTHQFGKYPARNNIFVMGVELYPYVAASLFKLSPQALRQQMISLDNLPERPLAGLNHRLATLPDVQEGVRIITHYLQQKLKPLAARYQPIFNAVQYIKRKNGHINIADLAAEFYLSQKQFERKFREVSGFTPKLYARIARFESSIHHFHPSGSLTAIAHEAGYYDPAHFIHDFRQFTGFNPKQYFSLVAS